MDFFKTIRMRAVISLSFIALLHTAIGGALSVPKPSVGFFAQGNQLTLITGAEQAPVSHFLVGAELIKADPLFVSDEPDVVKRLSPYQSIFNRVGLLKRAADQGKLTAVTPAGNL